MKRSPQWFRIFTFLVSVALPVHAATPSIAQQNNQPSQETLTAEAQIFDLRDVDFWAEQCRSRFSEQRFSEALEACEKALVQESEQKQPSQSTPAQKQRKIDLWRTRATVLFQLGRYRDAIAGYDYVLNLAPASSEALAYKCEALSQLGNDEDAIAACEQATQINGDWGDRTPAVAWFAKGAALRRMAGLQTMPEQRFNLLTTALDAYDRASSLNAEDLLAPTERCETLLANSRLLSQREQYLTERSACIQGTTHSETWEAAPASAWYRRGLIFRHLNRSTPDAVLLKAFEAEIQPSNPLKVVLERKAQNAFQQATDRYERSLARNPQNAVAWTNQGMVLEHLYQDSNALISYDRAIQLNASQSLAQAQRCGVLNRLRRYQEALVACDSALQGSGTWGDSSPANAWSQRSNAQLGLGHHQDALASADRAIALQPSLAEAHNYRGVALWYLKQYTAARESVEKAIGIKPQFAQAYFSLGRIFSTQVAGEEPQSRYQAAVGAYDQALKQHLQLDVQVSCEDVLYNRSESIWRVNQDDRSFCAEILANQSAVYWQLGNYESARKAAVAAASLNPESFEAWYNQGVALVAIGYELAMTAPKRPEQAVEVFKSAGEAFEQAGKLRPDNVYVLTGQGRALEGQGKVWDATAAYDAALNIDPNYQVAKMRRAALAQNWQKKKALQGNKNSVKLGTEFKQSSGQSVLK